MAFSENTRVRRALISVSDKNGIVEFARSLSAHQIEILSTGGTAKLLVSNGIAVTEVSDFTGFPEIMDGRVKTLHPKIHGGILGRRGLDDQVMRANHIQEIDLIVVNLYPFAETIKNPACTLEQAIENIDIGGPAMIRAAAKNHEYVAVVVNPVDYTRVLNCLAQHKSHLTAELRFDLAVKAFEHTAKYDGMIANYLGSRVDQSTTPFPRTLNSQYRRLQVLRYGENPHQTAALYQHEHVDEACIAYATQIQGKELSFNNIVDSDAAWECVKQFEQPACVIVKHANPCGVAVTDNLLSAYQKAYVTDPTSAFGGIIAFNRKLDHQTAKTIVDQQFVEVIIAPEFEAKALETIQTKSNIRVLACGAFTKYCEQMELKYVVGGMLMQSRDLEVIKPHNLKVVTKRQPTAQEHQDLLFAWHVAKFVKSNAIVYAHQQQTIGVGAGQMSRVYSAKIAGIKAQDQGLNITGAVMASDAFFPFRDGIDAAHEMGIRAVIQPGGSKNDDQVIQAADEHHMAMIFTQMRHFRH